MKYRDYINGGRLMGEGDWIYYDDGIKIDKIITHSDFIKYKDSLIENNNINKILDDIDENVIQLYLRTKKLNRLSSKIHG